MKRTCLQCGKDVSPKSKSAQFCWLTPSGDEAWICGPRCAKKYNGDEEEEVEEGRG